MLSKETGKTPDPPPEPLPYTHRLFVDFSGDDGAPGNGNSSELISIAWVLSRVEDIHHNEGVVLQMKKALGCNPKDELKYKGIKRQEKRKRLQILEELSHAHVKVLVLIVMKRAIKEEVFQDPKTKRLVQFIHYFPIGRFFDMGAIPRYPNGWFQLVFDEVSWAGCRDGIRDLFDNDPGIIWDRKRDADSLLFGNSRSILMLQMADVFAGMMRDYFDALPADLPRCRMCNRKHQGDCHWRRAGSPVGSMRLLRLCCDCLIRDDDGEVLDVGLLVRPPEVQADYRFVDCLVAKQRK